MPLDQFLRSAIPIGAFPASEIGPQVARIKFAPQARPAARRLYPSRIAQTTFAKVVITPVAIDSTALTGIGMWRSLMLLALILVQPNSSVLAQDGPLFVTQVASRQSMDVAKQVLGSMQARYPSVFRDAKVHIHEVDLGVRGTWYRVQIGPPASRDDAERRCIALKQLGHSDCIVATAFEVGKTTPGHSGDLVLKPLSDGENMKIGEPIEFVDGQGRKWSVPAGATTDGASIPRALWSIVGSPFTGKYLKAAVIHDHYVRTKHRSWMDTHDVFYEAMISSGVDKKQALMMWAAVYRFGPRWTKDVSVCWGMCAGAARVEIRSAIIEPKFSEKHLNAILRKIESAPNKQLSDLKSIIDENIYEHWTEDQANATLRGEFKFTNDAGRSSGMRQQTMSAPYNWPTL